MTNVYESNVAGLGFKLATPGLTSDYIPDMKPTVLPGRPLYAGKIQDKYIFSYFGSNSYLLHWQSRRGHTMKNGKGTDQICFACHGSFSVM